MPDLVRSMRSVFIACEPDAVLDAVADIAAWPQWAVHNVRSERALPDGTFAIETPRGPGCIRAKMMRECGFLDHEFIDPRGGTWLVPGRVAAPSSRWHSRSRQECPTKRSPLARRISMTN